MDIDQLLVKLTQEGGSDLHLKVGAPPIMRKHNKLHILSKDLPVIDYQTIDDIILPVLNDIHQDNLRTNGSVDVGYGLKGIGRFRFNIFFQRGTTRVVVRHIPHNVPTIDSLNLPQQMLEIVNKIERGLVLITGATGVGKSTTLAALINHINKTKNKHIITIEDPIEFLIQDHYSLITQREMGVDYYDSKLALKAALRQDPDIILFSELRAKDTISIALNAAETGHLVFSTIHTQEAAETISRILSVFSAEEQARVKITLSSVLKAVFSQRLIPKKDNKSYIPAVEILVNNPRIQSEIMKDPSTDVIRNIMHQSQNHWGMQTFDQHLIKMLKEGLISEKDASKYSSSPEKIKLSAAGISFGSNYEQLSKKPPAKNATQSEIELNIHTQTNIQEQPFNPQKKRKL